MFGLKLEELKNTFTPEATKSSLSVHALERTILYKTLKSTFVTLNQT